jgi:hypothetical protein
MNSEPSNRAPPRRRYPAEGGESSGQTFCRFPAPCAPALVSLPADLRDLGLGLCPALHRCDAAGARALQLDAEPALSRRLAAARTAPLQRGDFIVFSFAGEAQARYPGLRGQPFFKIVRGLPGDAVTVAGRHVAINGEVVGVAKTAGLRPAAARRRLRPPSSRRALLRAGHQPRLLRLALPDSGLVRAEQVLGVVVPLF